MKKFVALMLAVLYITASGGVVMNVHYCMGNFSSVDIDSFKSDNCDKCGIANTSSGCCHSELKVVKVNYSHKASTVVYNLELPVADAPQQISLIDISRLLSSKIDKPVAHAPPLDISPDLNILHCIFRV
jgi:hypothetical protein